MKTTEEGSELQRLMNARLWRCIEENGKAQKIAQLTSLSAQTLYNMRDNRRFPATATIKAIKVAVPSLSYDALYSDEETDNYKSDKLTIVGSHRLDPDPTTPAPAAPGVNWHKMYETERAENIRLSKANERLTEKNERLYLTLLEKNGIMTDQEGSKIESSSQATAWAEVRQMEEEARERMQVEGYVRYPKDETPVIAMHSAKVMALPVTRAKSEGDANAA